MKRPFREQDTTECPSCKGRCVHGDIIYDECSADELVERWTCRACGRQYYIVYRAVETYDFEEDVSRYPFNAPLDKAPGQIV